MRKIVSLFLIFLVLTISYLLLAISQQSLAQDATVSITIPPKADNFSLSLTPDTTSTVPQGKAITYTITYGTNLSYVDSLTIEAYWNQGTINGASSPSIDGVDYVGGSATNAYNNTSPIINISNQKITWSISSFPANITGKTVSFQLKTNGSYTGTPTVDFPVKVRLLASNYTTTFQSIATTYQYDSSLITPTPTPGSSSSTSTSSSTSPTSTPTLIPTPPAGGSIPTIAIIPTTAPLHVTLPPTQSLSTPPSNAPVQNISIVNLSDSSTQIALSLNKTTSATVVYGLNPNALTDQLPVAIAGTDGNISLNNLNSDTTYYMQVVSKDDTGKTIKSEVFAVQTAKASAQPQMATASLVVASDNDVLYSAGLNNTPSNPSASLSKTPQIPIAQGTNYTFAFKLTKSNKIKTVSMTLINTSVLGISNFHPIAEPLSYSFPVIQKDNGIYGVQIKNPTVPGTYDVSIRVTDFDGNITTQKIAEVRVLKPFRVYNAATKNPIEDARIVIYRLNLETKKYDFLPNFGGTSNPIYTNGLGEVSIPLPKGTYKANFGRIGYNKQDNVIFSLGTTPRDDFPTVYLKPATITPLSILIYYSNALSDYLVASSQYIAAIQQSYRFFDLLSLIAIFCFVVLSFLLLQMKTHIILSHIPLFLHHTTLKLFQKQSPYIHGTIVNKTTKMPVTQATVYLIDEKTQRILASTKSNKLGAFLFSMTDGHHGILVIKEGFEASGIIGYTPNITIDLIPGEKQTKKLWHLILESLEDGLSLFFEFTLVCSLIFEIILFPAFGLWKTIPFLATSIINILVWFFFLHEKGKQLS